MEEYLKEQVLQTEASLRSISKDQFLREEIDNKINPTALDEFIRKQKFDSRGLISLSGGYRRVEAKSAEGETMVEQEYKEFLKQKLMDSLMKKHSIEILLQPPSPPPVNLDKLPIAHFRGNLNSSVSVLEISDFECPNCRSAYGAFKKIYEKYETRVRFGFTPFSSQLTLPAIVAEVATEQNKFWEMHDAIFQNAIISGADTSGYIKLASSLRLDTLKLRKQLGNSNFREAIQHNISYLQEKRIYATPTVVVNGKIVLDSFKPDQIEKAIEEALINK